MKIVAAFWFVFPPLSWALHVVHYPSDVVQRANETLRLQTTARRRSSKSAYDLCWVHIGKSGGMSITQALSSLEEKHALNFVQVHLDEDRFEGKSLGGPLVGNSLEVCKATGRVLTWVRDPISRLISCWNAKQDKEEIMEVIAHWLSEHGVDPNATFGNILSTLIQKDGAHALVHDLFDLIEHANMGAGFYFNDSCDILDQLPIHFIGRQEYMDQDWKKFLRRTTRGIKAELPHSHHTQHLGETLSPSVVTFLKTYYAADYRCIAKLSDMGYLSSDYVEMISNNQAYEFIIDTKSQAEFEHLMPLFKKDSVHL